MQSRIGTVAVLSLVGLAVIAIGALSGAGVAQDPGKLRIGTYDSRAIAVAWAASTYNPVGEKMKELQAAKAVGDEETVRELNAWGESQQRKLHRQGFGRVPVDDLLKPVADRLPEVARTAGVEAIVFSCEYAGPQVEVVDVTDEMVRLFDPSERTLSIVAQMKGVPPMDLDALEKLRDE